MVTSSRGRPPLADPHCVLSPAPAEPRDRQGLSQHPTTTRKLSNLRARSRGLWVTRTPGSNSCRHRPAPRPYSPLAVFPPERAPQTLWLPLNTSGDQRPLQPWSWLGLNYRTTGPTGTRGSQGPQRTMGTGDHGGTTRTWGPWGQQDHRNWLQKQLPPLKPPAPAALRPLGGDNHKPCPGLCPRAALGPEQPGRQHQAGPHSGQLSSFPSPQAKSHL